MPAWVLLSCFGNTQKYVYLSYRQIGIKMKKYIIESLISSVIYCIGLLAVDARPGHQFKAVGFYLLSSIIFGLLFSFVMWLIRKRIGRKSDK
jgi:hypothetical protein